MFNTPKGRENPHLGKERAAFNVHRKMQNENTERNRPFSKGVILTLLYFGHHFSKLKDNAQGIFTCNTYQFGFLLLCH